MYAVLFSKPREHMYVLLFSKPREHMYGLLFSKPREHMYALLFSKLHENMYSLLFSKAHEHMYLVKAGAVKCCCFFEKTAYSGPDCPSCGAAVPLYCLCLPAGAYFLQQVTKRYEELRQQDHYGDEHTMDNILLLLVYLYNFKVGSSWLLFFASSYLYYAQWFFLWGLCRSKHGVMKMFISDGACVCSVVKVTRYPVLV